MQWNINITSLTSDWSASRPISSFVAVYLTILNCWLVIVSTANMSFTGISDDPEMLTRPTFDSCSNFSFISSLSAWDNATSSNYHITMVWTALQLLIMMQQKSTVSLSTSSSSSSSTNFIATQVLNKTSGPLCVTYYTTAVMSMLLWPIVCIAVWSAEQFRLQCTLECPQRRQQHDRQRQRIPNLCRGNRKGAIADGPVQRPWNMPRLWRCIM